MLLKLDNVKTYYGNIRALKGISLEIAEGEIVCLIGGNGAGKSTSLMTISLRKKGMLSIKGSQLSLCVLTISFSWASARCRRAV